MSSFRRAGKEESLVVCGDCGESLGSFADLKIRLADQAFPPELRAREALRRISINIWQHSCPRRGLDSRSEGWATSAAEAHLGLS